ncbi:UNVERIFIED_CONTAM: hypothetical protein Slati_0958800 [Sesamum latifolium]|uniref:Uncharacterized protein n=1 Tax=Sesamum latifolium TaxID=2727402 RepID=A0AAW2XTX8_9LAMI
MKFALGSRMKLSFIDGELFGRLKTLQTWMNGYERITWVIYPSLNITKLRKLWDELACLDPLPVCTCTAHRGIVIREASHQMMQFLMGLSTPFANIRSQILVMDPRPDVVKAFAMLLNVEKELHVHTQFPENSKALAYKLSIRKKGGGRGRGAFTGNITDGSSQYLKNSEGNLSDILRSELKKLLHEDNASDERQRTPLDMVQIHFAEVEEFAGPED